jgi:hypothetical protein
MRHGWRVAFIGAGVLIMWGGSLHPGGTMEQMLADPQWRFGHMLTFAGFVLMTAGIWLLMPRAPARLARTATLALVATALQAFEMFLHAIADMDLENLRAGASTPILSTHLMLTGIVYPIFAAAVMLFIVRAARERVLGSLWIAWLGLLGAAMHGIAGPGTVFFEVAWARALFPGVVLLALWMILAALWRAPVAAGRTAPV